MTSSHRTDVLFTPVEKTVGRTVRRDSMSIRIRDLKSYTIFHGDSEKYEFHVTSKAAVTFSIFGLFHGQGSRDLTTLTRLEALAYTVFAAAATLNVT